jgi:histidinol-phosphatase
MIRDVLARERPDDGIVGEEFGSETRARNWIIDPIDATKNYVRRIPVFATLIALDDRIGVVSAPALQRRWWTSRGDGAFCNGRAIHASRIDTVESAYADLPYGDDTAPLIRRCGRTRCFGDFWQHMLVAEGSIEIAYDPIAAWWDMAPILVIVEEAGGRFTNRAGEARADGGSGVSTNGALHETVLHALSSGA